MRCLELEALVAALVLTLPGQAAWPAPPATKYERVGRVHVSLKGLNLNNPEDARTLLTRINEAAYKACGGNPKVNTSYRSRPQKTIEVYEECRANAVKRAVDQIGAPALRRAYDEAASR
jgi:UrcA family protein